MKNTSLLVLPKAVIKVGVTLRSAGLVAAEPIDYVSRLINSESELPPLRLRHYVGPLKGFRRSGVEYYLYLKLLCQLLPSDRILDIGCGCGLMAIELKEYLDGAGKYTGADIHKDSIKWCQKKLTSKYKNFTFFHIDVENRTYNPKGKHAAEHFVFPFVDGAFDLILLKSVFTHMRPAEVDNYLKEIRRLLSERGRCLATFFLLNEQYEKHRKDGDSKLTFDFGDQTWRYMYKNRPEAAVAFSEDYVTTLLLKNRLQIEQIKYGTWNGERTGLSHQDILIIKKDNGF